MLNPITPPHIVDINEYRKRRAMLALGLGMLTRHCMFCGQAGVTLYKRNEGRICCDCVADADKWFWRNVS